MVGELDQQRPFSLWKGIKMKNLIKFLPKNKWFLIISGKKAKRKIIANKERANYFVWADRH